MFSGIVEEVGSVIEARDSKDGRLLKIEAAMLAPQLKLGESISVSGCCLTVVDQQSSWFAVEAVHETLSRTKIGALKVGSTANLEPALRLTDRLGGHLVSGHVDAVAQVKSIVEEGFSKRVTFEMNGTWSPFFIEKGSVAVDGVSLTVAGVDPMPQKKLSSTNFAFNVVLIPHTLSVTTFATLKAGDQVNVEVDMVAKYIARWFGADNVNEALSNRRAVVEEALVTLDSRAR